MIELFLQAPLLRPQLSSQSEQTEQAHDKGACNSPGKRKVRIRMLGSRQVIYDYVERADNRRAI